VYRLLYVKVLTFSCFTSQHSDAFIVLFKCVPFLKPVRINRRKT